MLRKTWTALAPYCTPRGRAPRPAARPRSNQPQLELLEDRTAPSATPAVDLTTAGADGVINGAIFRQFTMRPTGTGYIDSFVRLQAKGAGTQAEQGYNTDARPLSYDENNSPQFTRSLLLSSVPLVDIGGVKYREFELDINQKASQPLLSLDQLRLYTAGVGNLSGTNPWASASLAYDMGAGNWVKLNARLSTGSGSGDMLLYVPDSDFAGGGPYVYLYSNFGANYMATSGFEEWAVGHGGVSLTQQTGGAGGSISGTVTSNTGAPLADVVVFLDTSGNGTFNPATDVYTVTDANGNYSFNGLTTGLGTLSTYNVYVVASSGYTVDANSVEQYVSLQTSGQQVTGINFVLDTASAPPPTQPPGVSS